MFGCIDGVEWARETPLVRSPHVSNIMWEVLLDINAHELYELWLSGLKRQEACCAVVTAAQHGGRGVGMFWLGAGWG